MWSDLYSGKIYSGLASTSLINTKSITLFSQALGYLTAGVNIFLYGVKQVAEISSDFHSIILVNSERVLSAGVSAECMLLKSL